MMDSRLLWTLIVAGCTCALAAPASVQADDWNVGAGGNSTRDGRSTEIGPITPEILWQGSLSAIVAQQGVIEGDVFVAARITSFTIPTGTTIVAHDLNTGEILWEQQLPFNFPDAWRSRVSSIRDGQVYATRAGNTNLDFLYALDANDGSIVWESEALVDESTTESVAFTDNGDVIAGNFSSLLRISRFDGATVWSVPRSCPTSGGCSAVVFAGKVYIWEAGVNGPVVSVFDVDTGEKLYSSAGIGGGFIQQLGLFVGPDGTVYAPRSQNNVLTDFLVAFEDTGTGLMEKWSVPLGFVPFGTFAVGPDGSVYSYLTDMEPSNTIEILRLDPANGDMLGSSGPLATDHASSPRIAVDSLGTIFFTNGGFANGAMYSFNSDLSLRWSEPITNVNVGGPAVGSGGVVVVCGVGTDVRAYQTALPFDADMDGDVDLRDVASFQSCFTTDDAMNLPAECEVHDYSLDEAVGVVDHAALVAALSGPAL